MLVMTAMTDRMCLKLMQSIPEMQGELGEATRVTGSRRHHEWMKSVEEMLSRRDVPLQAEES
jgi:hypothetical protein